MFGHNGTDSKELLWADIRKRLRENKKEQYSDSKSVFIGYVLNPDSWVVKQWKLLVMLVGVYHFVVVPIRICFVPWSTMLDIRVLCTDLLADIITMLNVFVSANISYKNSRAVWITDRYKIVKKVHVGFYIAAAPLDWFRLFSQ